MYGLDVGQFRTLIVRPVLKFIQLHSPVAEALTLGTCLHESHLKYVKQLGTGPAVGPAQMEPATHYDIWTNFIRYRPELQSKLRRLSYSVPGSILGVPDPEEMIGNWNYAVAMCRVQYFRSKDPLPALDPLALAQAWKKIYNTQLGKGKVEEALPHFIEACNDTSST
jgi:hypothetical protein